MKLVTKVAMVLLFAAPTLAVAQTQKYGHVNSQELLAEMPQIIKIQDSVQRLIKQYDEASLELQNEYQKKAGQYQASAAGWPEAVRNNKEKEIRNLEQRLQEYQQEAQNDILATRDSLMKPVIQTVKDAIKGVAQEQKMSYVFDESTGVLLYSDDTLDITGLVRKRLGLK